MAYNAYPTWLGQGATPQFYKAPASTQFGTQGLGVSPLAQVGTVFGGGYQYGAPPQFGAVQYGAPLAPQYAAPQFAAPQYSAPQYGGAQFGATAAYPTWMGSGPMPDFYKAPAQFDIGQAARLSAPQFGGAQFGQTVVPMMTSAAQQINGAFPTWFGTGPAPDFYKPAANFGLGVGQYAPDQGFSLAGAGASGAQQFGNVYGSAFPTWLGNGPIPEFYKPPASFDIGNTNFLSNAPRGFPEGADGAGFGWNNAHPGLGGFQGMQGQQPFGVDHSRLLNEIRTFEYSGHGFHSGLRGAGSLIDSASGPRDLPVDPAHQQLMQEVRVFESHEQPGAHPGLKGAGTAVDTASGPKDLPDDPQHKKLMEEVRKHSE